jgi:hypothetical protein
MIALARPHPTQSTAAVPMAWDLGWMVLMVLLVLAAPPAIYGALSYYRFGIFKPSFYVPYEEFLVSLGSGDALAIVAAPLLSVNMTSGEMLANMYSVTLGQYALSIALGVAMGLTTAKQLYLGRICPAKGIGGTTTAAGSGLFATVAASSTGILGCCGSGLAGGVLTLLGFGSNVASQLAGISPLIQVALIALFVVFNVRLGARLKALAPTAAASG